MMSLLLLQGGADFAHYAFDIAEIRFAGTQTGRADANEGNVRFANRDGCVIGGAKASCFFSIDEEFVDPNSTIGLRPEPNISTLARFVSTPITWWPK